mmetsp:Transcript_40832/g.93080  ORF Transcript_40832/g.93080 Transcript_40832/m.93080 type:complete len:241 (-) Transcript_40832:88-810(-)|eukprot:CAMPEP_0180353142 /NCGR_PEP_ID=MMETSP0989-20121125/7470_1 /TAXON_ID=697907 /ORGANISM="non described non described, Strain CCMP2293" /LENGTH=240 /DNA_ID=CAMNT_0022342763 /DNA_START=1 /DNA_END=723 /DNA_ORIENTATION=+
MKYFFCDRFSKHSNAPPTRETALPPGAKLRLFKETETVKSDRMTAAMGHAMKLDTACASSFAEASALSEQNTHSGSKRSRPVDRAVHWRPGMGLEDDSADLPAAKRATLANISLLYKSLEAATWECIADLKRKDEEERQQSRVIAERNPIKFRAALTSPHGRARASAIETVGSPPEEDAPTVPTTKKWLTTPQLVPLARPVLSFEEATAKAAKLDISRSLSTPTPDAECFTAKDMPELSI